MWPAKFNLIYTLALVILLPCVPQVAAGSPEEPAPPVVYFQLDEVFRRLDSIRDKPREEMFEKYLLRADSTLQPELLIFRDPETGHEIWRLTSDFSRNTPHCHINRSPWNADGSLFAFNSDRWFPEAVSRLSAKRMFVLRADGSGLRNLMPRLEGQPFPDVVAYARHAIWDREAPQVMYFVDRDWFYRADLADGASLERVGALDPPGRRREIYSYPSDNDIVMVKDRGSRDYAAKLYFFDMKKSSPSYGKLVQAYSFGLGLDEPGHSRDNEWHLHDITFRRDPADRYVLDYGPFDTPGEPIFFDFPLDGDRAKVSLCYAAKSGTRPYFSHPAWAAGGGLVAYFGESERNRDDSGLQVWDYSNDRHLLRLTDSGQASGGHIAWDGYDRRNFFASPSQIPEFSLGGKIIWAHLDSGTIEVLCSTHTRWQPGEHDYCALARPAQSPDGTKCFFSSTLMQPEAGAYDCYIVVARRPAPPDSLSVEKSGAGLLLTWQPPELSREVKLYRVYRLVGENNSFQPLAECPCGRNFYLDSTVPAGSTCYYALTSEEHSGLESDRLSRVVEVKIDSAGNVATRITLKSGGNWDIIRPEPPAGLSARPVEPGRNWLTWGASGSGDVRYYNLYYSRSGRPTIDPIHLIATLPRDEQGYLDWSAPKSGPGFYALIAVDRQDNLSRPVFCELK